MKVKIFFVSLFSILCISCEKEEISDIESNNLYLPELESSKRRPPLPGPCPRQLRSVNGKMVLVKVNC